MKPTTLEWLNKAEDDWHVAQMTYRARKHPSYDAAVFHAQQCAEKYLKARLEEASIAFTRTHDLLMLHQFVLPIEPTWHIVQTPLALWRIGTLVSMPRKQTQKTRSTIVEKDVCREGRRVIRTAFGLPI